MFGKKKKKNLQVVEEDIEPEEDLEVEEEVEEPKPTKKKEVKEIYKVVKELPTQAVRQAKAKDGTIVNFVTIEEALTEVINQ